MTCTLNLREAVSAPEETPNVSRYCLLRGADRDAYHCAETAAKLSSTEETTRVCAFWTHFKTHIQAYARWAARRHYVDPDLLDLGDPSERAQELVIAVIMHFLDQVRTGCYDYHRALPCKYLKRAIHNAFFNRLKRNRIPTTNECFTCWRDHGEHCPSFHASQPWIQTYRQCRKPPTVTSLEQTPMLDTIIAGQEEWPPLMMEISGWSGDARPVEEIVIQRMLIDRVYAVMEEILTPEQHIILVESMVHLSTARQIALIIGKSPDNVYKLRKRALEKLSKALSGEL